MTGPYGGTAFKYWEADWHGVIPLPYGEKFPPPPGYTAAGGMYPSYADVYAWSEGPEAEGNLGLRPPVDVIGIDVDAYGEKAGEVTLANLVTQYGHLPPTYTTSSRNDGTSRIHWFRVPPGLRWRGKAGEGIELIAWNYRYAVMPPSVHPNGGIYAWRAPDGAVCDIPRPEHLAEMPIPWVAPHVNDAPFLSSGDFSDVQVLAFLNVLPGGQPCSEVKSYLADRISRLGDPTKGRHDTMLTAVMHLIRCGTEGHIGIPAALRELQSVFIDAVTRPGEGQRSHDEAGREWVRALVGGVARVAGEPLIEYDPCVAPLGALRHDPHGGAVPTGQPEPAEPGAAATGSGEGIADGQPWAPPTRRTLADVHDAFTRWLGSGYDLGSLDAVLAAAAVEQLDGDPVWLLVVSGSGNAKTETVSALAGSGATITSTITSDGALLSGTARKDKSSDATGGLLRKLGSRGVLVIKDFTSIISMNRDLRSILMAALREVYDGRWERNVGTDGGRTLSWTGRLAVVGAVTTAYDSAHAVLASMGDRFALVRVDSSTGRAAGGRQALRNVGQEEAMRAELAEAVGGLLAYLATDRAVLTEQVMERLLAAADLVTLGRTAVERDYRGDVIDAHAPEMPTRFAKQLGQILRGGLALGMTEADALALALRVARDSMPPLRLRLLVDVAAHPLTGTSDAARRVGKPRTTVDRVLQELDALGLIVKDEIPYGDVKVKWIYRLAPETMIDSLNFTRNVSTGDLGIEKELNDHGLRPSLVPDISGEPVASTPCQCPNGGYGIHAETCPTR